MSKNSNSLNRSSMKVLSKSTFLLAVGLTAFTCKENTEVESLKIAPTLQMRFIDKSGEDMFSSNQISKSDFSFFSTSKTYPVKFTTISDTVIIHVFDVFFDSRDMGISEFYVQLNSMETDTLFVKAISRLHPDNSPTVSVIADIDEFKIVEYNGKEVPALYLRHFGKFVGWPKYFEIVK